MRKKSVFFFQLCQSIVVTLVSVLYCGDFKMQLYRTHLEVVSGDKTFYSRQEPVTQLSLASLYIAVPWITTLHYFVVVYVRRVPNIRWYEYALSASLMTVTFACMSGISDVHALVNLVAGNVAVQMFGLFADNASTSGVKVPLLACSREDTEKIRRRLVLERKRQGQYFLHFFYSGAVVFAIQWSTVLHSFYATVDQGEGPPDFVYALIIVMTLLYCVFPGIMLWKGPGEGDHAYDIASVVSKFALDWILVGGFIGWTQA